jgi:ferredoxin
VAQPGEWPAALEGLPLCPVRKLPVPFSAEWDDSGRAVFTALDPERKEEMIRDRLCGVCGRPLGYWMVFLGDVVSSVPGGEPYMDPPMHEDCALAAMEVCPFIQHERVPRRPAAPEDVLLAPPGSFEGPKRPWVMAVTHGFKMVPRRTWSADGEGIMMVYQPGSIVRTRRFEYREGRITEVTPARRRAVTRVQPPSRRRGRKK